MIACTCHSLRHPADVCQLKEGALNTDIAVHFEKLAVVKRISSSTWEEGRG